MPVIRIVTFAFLVCMHASMLPAADYRIDCSADAGTIRPLQGVNNGPLNYGETVDLSKHWRELAIPSTRLHDAEWPGCDVVDMHAVFPDLKADATNPASYRFLRTDDYLKPIIDAGSTIVYRLGESIEHTKRKHHVHPPADYDQWAAACLGIIRHYNEGWADGPRYKIQYWEIWNEPENRPAMWSGSDDDYYRLYAKAATAIKAKFPDLKVGGPSVGATGEVIDGELRPTAFLKGFLRECREKKLPLDFFSWHTYTDDPFLYARKAKAIRKWLDAAGFQKTEIHLNEWNHLPDNDWGPMLAGGDAAGRTKWYDKMSGPRGAAFVAAALIDLQDAPVDVANYYSGDSSPFGLFTREGVPKKTFYAMKAFRTLVDTPRRVKASGAIAGRSAVAAGLSKDRDALTIVIADLKGDEAQHMIRVENLPWEGEYTWTVRKLNDQHDLASVQQGKATGKELRVEQELRGPGVIVVQVRRSK